MQQFSHAIELTPRMPEPVVELDSSLLELAADEDEPALADDELEPLNVPVRGPGPRATLALVSAAAAAVVIGAACLLTGGPHLATSSPAQAAVAPSVAAPAATWPRVVVAALPQAPALGEAKADRPLAHPSGNDKRARRAKGK